jgi:hypothetical protein
MVNPIPDRVSLTVRVRKDIADEARRVAREEAGKPRFLKLNLLVEQALVAYLAALRAENEGGIASRDFNHSRSRR